MEFVQPTTTEEKLLLTLIDRIDRIDDTTHKVQMLLTPHEPSQNPLEDFIPIKQPDVIMEAQLVRERILTDFIFDRADPKICRIYLSIRHPVNVALLRRNGFQIDQKIPDMYEISWRNQ